MKDYYQIHEISQLYGIGPDSLRYYERLGILKPKRGENGYRLYSLKDIYKLNIIRDLRKLGFSMQQIREYLDDLSLSNTLALLREELAYTEEQLAALRRSRAVLRSRLAQVEALARTPDGQPALRTLPERRCLQLSMQITRDEETDFAIRKLHKQYEGVLQELGDQRLGAVPVTETAPEAYAKGGTGTYRSVFFILDGAPSDYDVLLPAGTYLCLLFRGPYTEAPRQIVALLEYARVHRLRKAGEPIELYHIDNRYTLRPEEYLTELQMRVEA